MAMHKHSAEWMSQCWWGAEAIIHRDAVWKHCRACALPHDRVQTARVRRCCDVAPMCARAGHLSAHAAEGDAGHPRRGGGPWGRPDRGRDRHHPRRARPQPQNRRHLHDALRQGAPPAEPVLASGRGTPLAGATCAAPLTGRVPHDGSCCSERNHYKHRPTCIPVRFII